MTLSSLLEGVTVSKMFQTTYGGMVVTHDVEIGGLQYDSRKIQQGDMFIAIKGVSTDGHNHIGDAVSSGARAVVMENDAQLPDSFFMHAGVVKIVVGNSRRALAVMSANYFGHPAKQLRLIGVTGTNGKTTTTYLIKQLLELSSPSMQGKVGLIGTIEYMVGEGKYPATHTTPESLELHKLFATMVQKGCTHVVMEVRRIRFIKIAYTGWSSRRQSSQI